MTAMPGIELLGQLKIRLKSRRVCEYSEERTIEGAFSATLSSNVFSQSRLASNQRLMNQIGNLVTFQVGENQNWIKSGQKILKIKNGKSGKFGLTFWFSLSYFEINFVSNLRIRMRHI